MADLPFSSGARDPLPSHPRGGELIRLCDYIQDILPPFTQSADRQPFTPTRNGASPIINSRANNNTILVYPGTFNPAHEGHLNLLRHAMANAGEDLHIIAAIVLVADDAQMLERRGREGAAVVDPDLHLSQQQRSALWRSEKLQENRVWIYDSTLGSYVEFRDRLLRKARADGINLSFMLLCGPQELCRQTPVNPGEWGCVGLVTSDLCSPAPFAEVYGFPALDLPGYTQWSVVNPAGTHPDTQRLEPGGLGNHNTNPSDAMVLDPPDIDMHQAHDTNTILWHCESLDNFGAIRFLQTHSSEHRRQLYSAEDIRRCIARAPLTSYEELGRALRGVALNPRLLLEYAFRNLKPDDWVVDWAAYRAGVDEILHAASGATEEQKEALDKAWAEALSRTNQVVGADDGGTSAGTAAETKPGEGGSGSASLDHLVAYLAARGVPFRSAFTAIDEATPVSVLRSTLTRSDPAQPLGTPDPDSIAGDEEKRAEPAISASRHRVPQPGWLHVRRPRVRYPIWDYSQDLSIQYSRVVGGDCSMDFGGDFSRDLSDDE